MTRTSLVAALLAAAIAPASASAATIQVTTTADSGPGSLRQAISTAADPGTDDIVFAAGGTGTIEVGPTQLPMLATGTTVTATRTGGVPDVEIHCAAPSVGTGLQAGPGQTGVAITGVSITNCTNGVFALGGASLTLRGSWIGRSRTGATDGNTMNGVAAIAGGGLVVGGPGAGDGNQIVGNGAGVAATDPAAGSVVRGNAITGSTAAGVDFTNAPGLVVADNVVGGNATSGIFLFHGAGATVRGNRVGTDAAGAVAQPNGGDALVVAGTTGATISDNVVAGGPGETCAICVVADGTVRATGTIVTANRIGTTASGLAAIAPASYDGIRVAAADDTTIGAGNVIGGFTHFGIRVRLDSTGTVIQGNTVGLRADASGAIPNDTGIVATADAVGTRIAGNVVGGNRIGIYGAGAGTQVEGNLVGLAPDGRTVLGNEQGIVLEGPAAAMRVGGANVVSGNSYLGVVLKSTAGAVVAGNVIGRTADGTESRPNGLLGGVILIDNQGGVVGGDAPGDANLIDGGVYPSIRAEGAAQLGTQLLGNLLRGTPHSIGIDLLPPAVTANDPADGDAGPNGLQNAPVLTAARRTAVTGTLATKPSTPARIQLFSSSADGRETYALLGEAAVTTDAAGAAAFSLPVALAEGSSVVATATTGDGTSELSPPARVTVPRFGLRGARFSVRGKQLRVKIRNGTGAAVRVRVKGKDTRRSVRAAGTLKAVTKTIKAGDHATFRLKLPASTRRKLAAARHRDNARYRPVVTVTNLTSGIKQTYKPKIRL